MLMMPPGGDAATAKDHDRPTAANSAPILTSAPATAATMPRKATWPSASVKYARRRNTAWTPSTPQTIPVRISSTRVRPGESAHPRPSSWASIFMGESHGRWPLSHCAAVTPDGGPGAG
ncbi:hypothetical protein GCM10010191_05080 [Actinomadura vinacea]|uniref:Uncharacterized protein n=1 Tax=Actinomadura vinacea TaxID=115336 RepID=A0ABN3IEN7_9ACTN